MAVSAEALHRLHRYAEQGGFAPVLSIGVSSHEPEIGSRVVFTWDFRELGEAMGELAVPGEVFAIQGVGRHVIEVPEHDFTVTLAAAGQVASATIRPQAVLPVIERLYAHGSCVAGEPLTVRWQTRRTASCHLEILLNDEALLNGAVECRGERVVTPERRGILVARLRARSVHSHLRPEATSDRSAIVEIAAPPMRIRTSTQSLQLPVGEEGGFSWRVDNAARIRLVALNRGRSFVLQPTGEVLLAAGLIDETCLIEAQDPDGRTIAQEVRVTPAGPELSYPADLMCALDRQWTEELR